MAGRPRKSIAQKAADGDTKKLGALRHQELIDAAWTSRRGRPPMPQSLCEVELDRKATKAQLEAEILRERARVHYGYLVDQLEADGLLCPADNGILEGMAWTYAAEMECFESGAFGRALELNKRYAQDTNLVGLNESARAKIPKPTKPQMSNMDLGLADGLPDDDQPSIQ